MIPWYGAELCQSELVHVHLFSLQVKNIIFHSMKDIVGLLKSTVK